MMNHCYQVTIYSIRRSEERPQEGFELYFAPLDRVSIQLGGSRAEELAAKAWVLSVGVERRRQLRQLNAPEMLLQYQTDVQAIAARLHRAPAAFGLMQSYVLDNRIESWLIHVSGPPLPSGTGAGLGEPARPGRPWQGEACIPPAILQRFRQPPLNH